MNKVTESYHDTHTLPDGTKLKIVVENYEQKLFPMGDPFFCKVSINYEKRQGTRWVEFCKDPLSEEAMKTHVNSIIESLKKDPMSYKSQFASK